MKRLTILLLTAASLSATAHDTFNKELVFIGNTQFSSFCKAAIEDNVSLMRRSFSKNVGVVATNKEGVYEILLEEENLACNGMGIIEFSKQRNAEQVVSYLQNISQNM